jgi:5-methylcytosine-specific restriction endonuclease McrA
MADCHPEREHWARGLCSTCYATDYVARTGYKRIGGRRTTGQNRLKMQQRRAAMHGVNFEPVTVNDLAARDGWVCWLCEQDIDPDAPWPTVGYPTLDHVVPISRHGAHTADNLRLAHHGCNSRRGDRAA